MPISVVYYTHNGGKMNYYIEKHDMEMILDALEVLHNQMKTRMDFGLPTERPYSIEDVDGLFQSLDNSCVD
jgi:hypothetical protein